MAGRPARRVVLLTAVAVAGSTLLSPAAPARTGASRPHEPRGQRLLVSRQGMIVSTNAGRGSQSLLAADDAVWSPDGTLVAYVHGGDLWLANGDGSGRRPLTSTPDVAESEPSWSPNGQAIAYTATASGGPSRVRLLRLPLGKSSVLVGAGASSPAFSPRGTIAYVFARSGSPAVYVAAADGKGAHLFDPVAPAGPPPTALGDLAWRPDGGALAYTATAADGTSAVVVDDGSTRTVVSAVGEDAATPVWAPDGTRLAWARLGGAGGPRLIVANADGSGATDMRAGTPRDWRTVPLGRPLFPNLVQRPPSGLVVTRLDGRWKLGFTSIVDNRGPGILWIHGNRPGARRSMNATQIVELAGGATRTVPGAGLLHYTVAPPHYHWHLLAYERYTLRRYSNLRVVVHDRKTGFCLRDDYPIALGVRAGRAHFLADCAQYAPRARSLDEGTSVGYADRYPAFFHGQSLDLSGLRAGRYWLVHQVNSTFGLRESRYDDDTASVLVRLSWPNGRGNAPVVRQLRTCLQLRCAR